MKTTFVNRYLKLVIMLFIIFTFIGCIVYADDLSTMVTNYFKKGFKGNVVHYTLESSTGKKSEVQKICFSMPSSDGQNVFIDGNTGNLYYKGEQQIKFNVTFKSGSYSTTFSNPTLILAKDGKAN